MDKQRPKFKIIIHEFMNKFIEIYKKTCKQERDMGKENQRKHRKINIGF